MSAPAPAIGRLIERLPVRLGPTDVTESAVAQACALVPRILAAESARLPAEASGWTVRHAFVTSTRMVVVMLARSDGAPGAVVKLPMTAEGAEALRREGRSLAELHADARLADWRALIPRPWAFGEVLGQPCRIDHALPGAPLVRDVGEMRDDAALGRAEWRAAAAIDKLHRATAARVVVDDALAEQWVDARLESAFGRSWRSHSAASALVALRHELRGALHGRELFASRIHGDYWLGNVLFSPDGAGVEGIVDWDATAAVDLPSHDIVHLLLSGRRLRTGEELGRIVQRRLAGERWTPEERELLDRYGAWSHDGALSNRHAVLLYWLGHVALHRGQHGAGGGIRHRLWETRNVSRVLGAL